MIYFFFFTIRFSLFGKGWDRVASIRWWRINRYIGGEMLKLFSSSISTVVSGLGCFTYGICPNFVYISRLPRVQVEQTWHKWSNSQKYWEDNTVIVLTRSALDFGSRSACNFSKHWKWRVRACTMVYVLFFFMGVKFVRNLFLNISWKIISMTTYILLKI